MFAQWGCLNWSSCRPTRLVTFTWTFGSLKVLKKATGFLSWQTVLSVILLIHHASSFQLIRKSMPVCSYSPARIQSICSVGNHFFQTLAKMATSGIFFKLDNKYQINNTVMFNKLFCRFWQVINFFKKDQHSLKSCVDLFLLNFDVFVFQVLMRSIKHACQTRFRHIFNFMFSLRIRLKYFKTKLFYLH